MNKISINTVRNESDILPIFLNSSCETKLTITEKLLVDERKNIVSSFSDKHDTYTNIFLMLLKELANKREQERYQDVVDNLETQVVSALFRFSEDESYFDLVEHHICDIEHKYSFETMGTVIQSIYVKYNDKPKMLAGICRALCRFDLQEVMPWGPTMLAGLLNNKSELVKEYAVELIENWSDKSMLPLLKSLECNSKWLRDYIQDVINNLEE